MHAGRAVILKRMNELKDESLLTATYVQRK